MANAVALFHEHAPRSYPLSFCLYPLSFKFLTPRASSLVPFHEVIFDFLIGQPARQSFSIHFRKDLRLAGHRHFLSFRHFENSQNVQVPL
jgi:hypothetical protein